MKKLPPFGGEIGASRQKAANGMKAPSAMMMPRLFDKRHVTELRNPAMVTRIKNRLKPNSPEVK